MPLRMMIEFDKILFNEETNEWSAVNTETGETKVFISAKKKDTAKKTRTKKEENPNPILTLEDNKYILNAAAVELLGVQPEDRLDIKFEKNGNQMIPVLGTDEVFGTKCGNRITKSFSVSCRGRANQELSKYGTIFSIEPHPSKEGLFLIHGNRESNPVLMDEDIEIKEDTDIDLTDFLDDETSVTEINFNL